MSLLIPPPTSLTRQLSSSTVNLQHSLSVPVPPRIGPFSFGELIEGVRTQVQCVIQAGDLPLELRWLKDHAEISSELSIQITEDKYSSTLAIPRVGREHTGNYTCVASNEARASSSTANLVVSGNVDVLLCSAVSAATVCSCRTDTACSHSLSRCTRSTVVSECELCGVCTRELLMCLESQHYLSTALRPTQCTQTHYARCASTTALTYYCTFSMPVRVSLTRSLLYELQLCYYNNLVLKPISNTSSSKNQTNNDQFSLKCWLNRQH